MDLSQVPELEQALLQAVRGKFTGVARFEVTVLCRYDDDGPLTAGRNLIIGLHQVGVQLRPVGHTGRHTLVLKSRRPTTRTPAKVFRETRAGWFMVQNIAQHLDLMVKLEKAALQAETRDRQLQQTARNSVLRLEAQGLPEGCGLTPSTKLLGGLDLTVQGLSEPAMRQTMAFLKTLIREPNDESTGLWAQLQATDDA